MARGLLAITLTLALAIPAGASASSLPSGPGPEPGPELLYAPAPKPAPQLRNKAPWKADPLLVSGASAYVKGEFIYQDFIYDDHGAQGLSRDPSDPRTGDDTFSAPNGTYTYPTDVERYRNNIADLVEFRVKWHRHSTYFRLTFNSMTKPKAVATTIALGESDTPVELPFGANATAPAEQFMFVRGRKGMLLDAGEDSGKKLRTRVSKKRRQITFAIPSKIWDPQRSTVRMAAATGLWDKAAGTYLQPATEATATQPGGAAGLADPTALFNVAFRFDEPLPVIADPGSLADTAWWRENAQGAALASNDISPFFAEVDFGKLRSHQTDLMEDEPTGVPTTGPINRILSSRFSNGQGVQYADANCGVPEGCAGQYLDRLQPYAIYVPDKPVPPKGRGLTLLLHSLGGSFNQMQGTKNQSQFGDRGKGHIVITPESRGPDGWYYGLAGAEVFEVWADVARRYKLDPRKTAVTGYSMGGYGTYKFATQFPDLFASGQPTVGPPGLGIWVPGVTDPAPGSNTNPMLASLRHVPFMIWNGVEDELVPIAGVLEQRQTFADLGLEHIFDVFAIAEHFTFAINDEYGPAAEFMGERRVERRPAHVTYVRNPSMDFADLGTTADGAYWVRGVKTAGDGLGTIDAFSHGFGRADDEPSATQTSGGVLTGGAIPALAFERQFIEVTPGDSAPKADELELDAQNVAKAKVYVKQAKLSCDPDVTYTGDGPLELKLVGCPGAPVQLTP
ncbi:MAG: hypothetical protein QOI31_2138 [Solirubrobacterales bacterium]|nr:hypothetical protein [Solirubrobacterales bacterium]